MALSQDAATIQYQWYWIVCNDGVYVCEHKTCKPLSLLLTLITLTVPELKQGPVYGLLWTTSFQVSVLDSSFYEASASVHCIALKILTR